MCERIIAALSRHTRAASLLNAGVPPHVAQRYLGHLSPEDNNPASPGECVTRGLGGAVAGHGSRTAGTASGGSRQDGPLRSPGRPLVEVAGNSSLW